MKTLFLLLASMLAFSCSTPYKKTLYTLENESKPSWANLTKPMFEKNGKVFAVGVAEMEFDANFSAAKRISDNNAKMELVKQIKQELTSELSIHESGTSNRTSEYLASEKVDALVKNFVVEENWSEYVEFSKDFNGKRELHTYSLVSIKKDLLDKLKRELTEALDE